MFYPTLSRAALGGLLLCALAAAQSPTVEVKVLTATVDPITEDTRVEIQNQSLKVVAAYLLSIDELDADGKPIGHVNLGFDCLSYSPQEEDAREPGLIQPGAIATRTGFRAVLGTAAIHVDVGGVVYRDRSWEGTKDTVAPLFGHRAFLAENITKALDLFRSYPTTAEAFRATIQAARTIDPAHVDQVLYVNFKLSAEVASDDRRALPATVPVPERRDWQAAQDTLSSEAAFWAREAQQEVTK